MVNRGNVLRSVAGRKDGAESADSAGTVGQRAIQPDAEAIGTANYEAISLQRAMEGARAELGFVLME